jgi:hypothetical protein
MPMADQNVNHDLEKKKKHNKKGLVEWLKV